MQNTGVALRIMTWLAVVAAVSVAVILPAGYFISSYSYLSGKLEAEADVDAFFVSNVASSSPDLWMYQGPRLEGILGRRPLAGSDEQRRILDMSGAVVAETPVQTPWPRIVRSHRVYDAGRPVATVEISRSLRLGLFQTFFVALAGAGLGAVLYYLLSVLPISAARRAEQGLEAANAELQAGNDDLRLFIFVLSHDLRTPLVSIQGFSGELQSAVEELGSLARRDASTLSPAERARAADLLAEIPDSLRFIKSGVGRIHELVNAVARLSDLSRSEMKPVPLDMNAIVQAGLDALKPDIEKRHVRVEAEQLPDVFADRDAMREIIVNLLDNALKYCFPDRPPVVKISGARQAGETVIRVQDNGRGIAREDLPKIFGLFRQVGDQPSGGEGMGLVYVKTLVKRHNGRIWCESEPGKGSTFSMAFPEQIKDA
jgi:signal transduction histidine kinase